MLTRHISLLALLAALVVMGPFVGAYAAATCSGECCCGHSRLNSPCEDEFCLLSQPGHTQQAVVQSPEVRVLAVVELPAASESAVALEQGAVEVRPVALEYIPPEVFLTTQHFLN